MVLVFTILRVVLGLAFMLIGIMKLTDWISAGLYAQSAAEFVNFATVLNEFGLQIEPFHFLTAVGWVELVGGLLLAIGQGILQEISTITLAVVMMGEIYSFLMLKEPIYLCILPTVLLAFLLMFLYTWESGRQKQKTK
uniref:transmembrane protein 35B-like isoform X1 n=1 Tax=Pristiophorus japonicus TaxID=55135 RepID=UPI00398EE916